MYAIRSYYALSSNVFVVKSQIHAGGVITSYSIHYTKLYDYFRINAENTGQFERTLIIADEGSYVSYLEGCTAPQRDENQLHAAVVEIVVLDNAEVKYSTVQNFV